MSSDSNPNEHMFKEISLVPDYRALEIIRENQHELDQILINSPNEPIFKDITSEPRYKKFRAQLKEVEAYLVLKTVKELNSNTAAAIGRDLKQYFGVEREEICMILNQLPLTESLLEMMFPGKFSKQEASQLLRMINQHLGIAMPTTSVAKEEIKEE